MTLIKNILAKTILTIEHLIIAYEPDPLWEVSRDKVHIPKDPIILGEGSFGKVFKGEYLKDKEPIECAVKTVNENASARERIDFLNEADVMKY